MKLTTKLSSFEELVANAARVKLERASLDGPESGRLSREGFQRQALTFTKPERVERARVVVATLGERSHTQRFIRGIVADIRDGRCRSLPKHPESNAYFRQQGWDAATAELASEGLSPKDLLPLLVAEAANKHPGSFGTADDFERLEHRRRELDQKLAGMAEAIMAHPKTEGEVEWEEALSLDLRAQGFVRCWWRVSGRQVKAFGPNAGIELIGWVCSRPDVLKMLGVEV